MRKILMIDNFDSFTYNLVQGFRSLGTEVVVFRNDAITIDEAKALAPDFLVISPGPGRPKDAGISMEIIKAFASNVPILGVCSVSYTHLRAHETPEHLLWRLVV